MKQRILLVTGDAGEAYETLYAMHRFQEAGWDVDIAAPEKRLLNLVIHEMEPGWHTYTERPGYRVAANRVFDEVRVEDYEAILLIGGRAPEYLRNNQRVIEIVQEFHRLQKFVLAICHGVQVLVKAGLVKGTCMTCYEHVRYEVESAGGYYSTQEAVRDGKIITAQTWQSHPDFYRLVFAALLEEQPAAETAGAATN